MTTEPANLQALEDATPQLIAKLAELAQTLSPDEKRVLAEIVDSAALHTKVVQAHAEGSPDLIFSKPKSVHSTGEMKQQFIDLPKTLGLNTGDE